MLKKYVNSEEISAYGKIYKPILMSPSTVFKLL